VKRGKGAEKHAHKKDKADRKKTESENEKSDSQEFHFLHF
jgi:hypothetical protein